MNWILTRKGEQYVLEFCFDFYFSLFLFVFLFFLSSFLKELLRQESCCIVRWRRWKEELCHLQKMKRIPPSFNKKNSPQMAHAFASCPDMVVSFSGSLVQLVNFHVYTILLSHLVWLEKFSLSSLEILYNKVKSHSICFKINKNEINCLYFILHVGT